MTAATGRAFGAYRVLEELGSGSLSTVYRAVQEPLGRVVAVKALKSTIAPTSPFAAQLEREARVLATLNHPNVVALHDFVKTQSQMWLVLEYIDGVSLATVLGKRARFSPEFAATIGLEAARGLAHAHERGVVHRDVKPANVALSKRGDVKLVDFGIAQREQLPSADEPLVRAPRSEADAAFGTPAYMSPEQILGETVDARSDVFSLGVVLYQLLAGARPFDRPGDAEGDKRAAAQRIRRDPARPLRERAPEVPRPLERIVMRCLEKLPADRFASADEVAERLESFLRARTSESPQAIVLRALVAAGLAEGDPGTDRWLVEEKRAPLGGTMLGFGAILLVFALGGSWLQWNARGEREAAQAGSKRLELAPTNAGALRVIATPWAEVTIDGQRIDVTPIARPIPLAAGTHYVTLTHPNAPPEKRVVVINAGETAQLEATMKLAGLGDKSDKSDKDAGAAGAHVEDGGP